MSVGVLFDEFEVVVVEGLEEGLGDLECVMKDIVIVDVLCMLIGWFCGGVGGGCCCSR